MITVVALLFMPAVFAMSLFRLYQLPRDLLAGTRWLHPRHRLAAGLAAAATYLALAAYTAALMYTLARVIAAPPRTVEQALRTASVVVGYPLVYLAYEWICFYAIGPRSRP